MKRIDLIRHLEAHGCRLFTRGWESLGLLQSGNAKGIDRSAPSGDRDYRKIEDVPFLLNEAKESIAIPNGAQ